MSTIPDTFLEEVVRRLVAEFEPEKIFLFGSRAWGNPSDDSDVDILIIVDKSDEHPAKRSTRAYRCTRGLRTPMDLLVWNRAEMDSLTRTTTSMASEILEKGIVLYEQRG
jgi:uncharacterized protein